MFRKEKREYARARGVKQQTKRQRGARGIRALRGGLLWRRLSWPTSRPSSSCWSWRGTCAEGARGSSESTSRSACVHPACVRTPSEAHPDQSGCAYASTQDACVRPARRAGPERLRPSSMRAYAQRGAPDQSGCVHPACVRTRPARRTGPERHASTQRSAQLRSPHAFHAPRCGCRRNEAA